MINKHATKLLILLLLVVSTCAATKVCQINDRTVGFTDEHELGEYNSYMAEGNTTKASDLLKTDIDANHAAILATGDSVIIDEHGSDFDLNHITRIWVSGSESGDVGGYWVNDGAITCNG